MPIRYIGLEKLEEEEVDSVISLSDKYYTKVDRELNVNELIIDIKLNSVKGRRKEYTILTKAIFARNVLTAQASAWALRKSLHKVFAKLINEINHKFRKR